MKRPDGGSAAGKMSSETPLIIATRIFCNRCKLESVEAVDRQGITHQAFKMFQRAQVCKKCKINDLLEFLPTYKGESVSDTMNQILEEYQKQLQSHEQEVPIEELPLVQAASEAIMDKFTFITIEETGQVWYYEKGVYLAGGEILIAKQAEEMFCYKLTKGKLSEIIAHIMRRTYHKHKEIDADINIINLKNGLYDIDNDVLLPHTPEYLSINQKPINYVEGAKPKRFCQFLKEVLYPRNIRTATAAMAYTFHRDYIAEVIFILHGLGANGKTVYTSILTGVHGAENVSNVPLTDMLKDTFALSDMENKDVNIDNELAGQTVKETAVLKRLTAGSKQRIRIQRKNQRAYDTTLYAKLFFSANKIPESQDTSNAYNRRIIIVSFPNTFEKNTEDKQLAAKLTTEEEVSGIFNVLMTELRRIRHTKELYVNEKTIEEKRIRYERTIDPVGTFIAEAVSEYSTDSDYVIKELLYGAYVVYCNKYALPIEKFENFCRILNSKFQFGEREKRPVIEGKRVRVWTGIILVPEYAPKTEQTTLWPPCPP